MASKTAMTETAGILGDDWRSTRSKLLVEPSRELPVLWAIGKGSLLNKAIIVPLAFLFDLMPSAWMWCFSAVRASWPTSAEKVWHKIMRSGPLRMPTSPT